MSFDAKNADVVLYGVSGATWTWDGRTWSHDTAAPKASGPCTMAFDPAS